MQRRKLTYYDDCCEWVRMCRCVISHRIANLGNTWTDYNGGDNVNDWIWLFFAVILIPFFSLGLYVNYRKRDTMWTIIDILGLFGWLITGAIALYHIV